MPTWLVVLIIFVGEIIGGLIIGFIFEKKRKKREPIVGNLMVVDSDVDNEPPYIYLELQEGVNSICSKKTVSLNVKHISHK